MRGIALLFLLLGGALLVTALGGFADEWLNANATCGDDYSRRACAPGEAQAIMALVGGIFAFVALVLLGLSFMLGRAVGPLTATATSTFAGMAPAGAGFGASPATFPTAPLATPADPLVDRLSRLADLRDRGVLTEAEFQAQKARLL